MNHSIDDILVHCWLDGNVDNSQMEAVVEAKSQLLALFEREREISSRVAYSKGYDQGVLDSRLSNKEKTRERRLGYTNGWKRGRLTGEAEAIKRLGDEK